MGLCGKLTKLDKEILCNAAITLNFFVQLCQLATKPHLIGNLHKLAQIYFIVLLKIPPTYKDVDPPLAPPTALNNKHVL